MFQGFAKGRLILVFKGLEQLQIAHLYSRNLPKWDSENFVVQKTLRSYR